MGYELVVKRAKRIEGLLEHLGAEGVGLGSKIRSIEDHFDTATKLKLIRIKDIRNIIIHEDGKEPEGCLFNEFKKLTDSVIPDLHILIDNYGTVDWKASHEKHNHNMNKNSQQNTQSASPKPKESSDSQLQQSIDEIWSTMTGLAKFTDGVINFLKKL
ncbi:hypothetical protein ACOMICROBIO_LMKGKHOH_00137 [Vibrio sp. B1FIG11]|uniref:hypothetical protein n=1 Tax=Vibrio sp. B1FIG11 TaxID=2751177 RepID=UPI001AF5EBFD|nr:hypothetical protein [Vibrio sp. B1FIG11]CAD7814892.1 hypothetical protein ACOMICROBIO_LMKGKHOH_00137 [Vibrio sp. B1FIG11]CAE6923603.1 hypothetical protein ACOMICROBIO_LMKGKHOH_00137 [Vibrio sp. B1FIG11]